jgi:hypothetical protein
MVIKDFKSGSKGQFLMGFFPTGKINALLKLAPRHIPPRLKVSASPHFKKTALGVR